MAATSLPYSKTYDPMDNRHYYIQSHCIIRDRSISVNGEVFLTTDPDTTLADFLKSAYRRLAIDYPKFHKMDGLCKAIFIAAELLARESGPYPFDTALVFSNYSSSHLADVRHALDIHAGDHSAASPATFVYTLPNIAMGELSIRHQLHSENVFFIFDSFLPELLVPYTETLLGDKHVKGALSGWTEVTEKRCDMLLYRIGTTGNLPHTVERLKKLYNEDHE